MSKTTSRGGAAPAVAVRGAKAPTRTLKPKVVVAHEGAFGIRMYSAVAHSHPRSLASRKSSSGAPVRVSFEGIYRSGALDRVRVVKEGVPAASVGELAVELGISKDRLIETLGLGRATVDRKVNQNKALSVDETSRVVGLASLVGQVQALLQESGDPARTKDFDAAAWLAQWLEQPLPALDNHRPAEFMDTAEGQQLVSNLIARIQASAYS